MREKDLCHDLKDEKPIIASCQFEFKQSLSVSVSKTVHLVSEVGLENQKHSKDYKNTINRQKLQEVLYYC